MRPLRVTVIAIAGGYAVLLALMWWRVFAHHQVCAWDCLLEYWPDLRFQTDSLHAGSLPLWCPWSLGGYPFYADLQSGFYSPVNWICIVAGLVGGAGAWTIQLKVMLTMLVGLCGMHALGYARTRSHTAAFVAAVTYVAGSPILVHKNGAFLWPLMYLPLAILAAARWFDEPTLRRAALFALALWLCGSAGHPQGFFYDLVVVAVYVTYRFAALGHRAWLPFLRRSWRAIVALVLLATALLLIVYWPARTAIPLSERAVRDLDYVVDGYLSKHALHELFAPNLDSNWQWDVYVGPLALVGAAWALVRAQTRHARIDTCVWIAIAWLGMDLALGRNGHTLVWFYHHVPGFTLFRIAYRHKVIFGFAAAVLAGDGVAAAARARGRRELAWLGGCALTWLVAALVVARSALVVVQLAIVGLAVLRMWQWRRRRIVDVALCAAVFCDLWHAGALKLSIVQDYPRDPPPALLAAMPGVHDRWRYQVDDVVLPQGGSLAYADAYTHELRELSGYSNPIASQRSIDVEKLATKTPLVLAHFGVRYELGGHGAGKPLAGAHGYEYADVAPIARVYGAAQRMANPADILQALAATPPSALAAAYVEGDAPADVPASAFAPVDGTVASYEPGRIRVGVHAPGPGVLVVNEAWFPGWQASVNGRAAPTFRANYLLIGVVVPAGDADVVLEFSPPGYRLQLALFALALLVALTGALARWRWLDARPAAEARPAATLPAAAHDPDRATERAQSEHRTDAGDPA
jgi:hypothetical protein